MSSYTSMAQDTHSLSPTPRSLRVSGSFKKSSAAVKSAHMGHRWEASARVSRGWEMWARVSCRWEVCARMNRKWEVHLSVEGAHSGALPAVQNTPLLGGTSNEDLLASIQSKSALPQHILFCTARQGLAGGASVSCMPPGHIQAPVLRTSAASDNQSKPDFENKSEPAVPWHGEVVCWARMI